MAASSNSKTKSRSSTKAASTKKNTKGGKSAEKAAQPEQRPIRREVGAFVCLFLAIFAFIGFFTSAIFTDFFCGLMRGILGWGFYVLPVMLLVAAFVLGFHRGRPVILRVTCALLSTVFVAALTHLFLAGEYEWSSKLLPELFADGRLMLNGGVLGGLLSMACQSLFSTAGACILFVIALVFLLFTAFNFTIADIIDGIRNRPRLAYDEEPEPEATSSPQDKRRRTGKTNIDIPVDDDGPMIKKEIKPSLYDDRARVVKPDEFLKGAVPESPVGAPPEPVVAESSEVYVESEPEASKSFEITPIEPIKPPAKKAVSDQTTNRDIAESIEANLGLERTSYIFPPSNLLNEIIASGSGYGRNEASMNAKRLNDTIASFGISCEISNVTRGPSVTRYEMELEMGVKLNKLTNLADDLALSLGVSGVRIAPIPDRVSMVGIEVPNKQVSTVSLREIIESSQFEDAKSNLSFAIGKDIGGNCIVGDIAKLPHMLIAGTTGSGKSVCMNSLILSLLYKSTPDEVRFIMIDPKMIELGIYNGIPHLLIPVVTDPKKAAGALQWAVTEMMKRYRLFSETGARDILGYNALCEKNAELQKLPQIVIVIDELADLMLIAAKEVEESICRIAQMARAAGMHLIIATQRPSADVITGLMKANIPSRIAFAVASGLESRIILDSTGAEKLVGKGDMLFLPLGSGKAQRIQGAFVSDEERERVIEFVKSNSVTDYADDIMDQIEKAAMDKPKSGDVRDEQSDDDGDEMLSAAVEVVLESGQASVSMLQRRLKLGYSRAARIVDQMEERGIVGPFEGSKPRQVLITRAEWQERQYLTGGDIHVGNIGGGFERFDLDAYPVDEARDVTESVNE